MAKCMVFFPKKKISLQPHIQMTYPHSSLSLYRLLLPCGSHWKCGNLTLHQLQKPVFLCPSVAPPFAPKYPLGLCTHHSSFPSVLNSVGSTFQIDDTNIPFYVHSHTLPYMPFSLSRTGAITSLLVLCLPLCSPHSAQGDLLFKEIYSACYSPAFETFNGFPPCFFVKLGLPVMACKGPMWGGPFLPLLFTSRCSPHPLTSLYPLVVSFQFLKIINYLLPQGLNTVIPLLPGTSPQVFSPG